MNNKKSISSNDSSNFDSKQKIDAEKPKDPTGRIIGVDALRGLAILFMAFFHNFQVYTGGLTGYANSVSENPVAIVIEFLARWAGLFYLVSGFTHGYTSYKQFEKKKINPKKYIKKSIFIAVWLILLGRIFEFFFDRNSVGGGIYGFNQGPVHYTIFGSLLETGQIHFPDAFSLIFGMGPLELIGISILLNAIITSMLYKNDGFKNKERNLFVFLGIAIFWILISGNIIQVLRPIWVDALKSNNILLALLTGVLVADTHPLLPFFGYFMLGVFFGTAFVLKVNRKTILILGLTIGSIFTATGAIGYMIYGNPPVNNIIQTLTERTTELQIGLMTYLITAVYAWEMFPRIKTNKHLNRVRVLQLFGRFSLTVYLSEGFVSMLISTLILNWLIPGWSNSMFAVVIFALSQVLIWSLLLAYWDKKNMKYSVEWFTSTIIKRKKIIENKVANP